MEGNTNISTEGSMNETAAYHNGLSSGSFAIRVGKILACSVVLVIALVGNVFVILVVQKNANMKKTINYFIVNMAVSDLVVPCVILPRVIVQIASGQQTWLAMEGIAGNIMCKLMFFFSDLTMVVSILSLICITIDRFCAVVFPMNLSLITSRVRIWLIAFTWLFSMTIFAPYLYGFKLKKVDGKTQCLLQWTEDLSSHFKIQRAAAMTGSILFTVMPCIILTVMYTAILIVTRTTIVKEQHGNTARTRRQANNIKLLKLALITVGGFAFCYGPFNGFLFYATFILNWKFDINSVETFLFVAQFLTYTNSAVNPCLYFIFIENYRRGLKRILKIGQPQLSQQDTILNSRITARSRLDGKIANRILSDELRMPLSDQNEQNL